MSRHYLARHMVAHLAAGVPDTADPWHVTAPTLCGDLVEYPYVFSELSTPVDCADCNARADAL